MHWMQWHTGLTSVREATTGDNLSSSINGGSLAHSAAWPHVTPSSLLTHAESVPAANERLNTHAEHLHLSNHAPHEHQSSLVPCNVRWLIIFRPCHRSHFSLSLSRSPPPPLLFLSLSSSRFDRGLIIIVINYFFTCLLANDVASDRIRAMKTLIVEILNIEDDSLHLRRRISFHYN